MDSDRIENTIEMEKPMENCTETVQKENGIENLQMENGKEHPREESPTENGKDEMENGEKEMENGKDQLENGKDEGIEEVEDVKMEENLSEAVDVDGKMDVETVEVESVVEKSAEIKSEVEIETGKELPPEIVAVCENKKADVCEKKTQKDIVPEQNGVKKVAMCTSMDADTVRAAYNDVRADNTDTQWAVFKFEGAKIVCSATGIEFEKFREQFSESERAFGYIRLQTGDELSKRQKFLFVTWVGPEVSVIKRAKMSTDKSVMKNIISNFAVELQLESLSEFDLPYFTEALNKAGGANYGTGVRD